MVLVLVSRSYKCILKFATKSFLSHGCVAILGLLTAQSICIRFVNNIIVTLKAPKTVYDVILCGWLL